MGHSSPPSVGDTITAAIAGNISPCQPTTHWRCRATALVLLTTGAASGAIAGPITHGGYATTGDPVAASSGEYGALRIDHFERICLQPWRHRLDITFAGLLHGAQIYGQRITHSPHRPVRFELREPPLSG